VTDRLQTTGYSHLKNPHFADKTSQELFATIAESMMLICSF